MLNKRSNSRDGVRLVLSVLKKYRSLFLRVYVLACAMQLLSLVMPVAVQTIFDKVIMHQSHSTLNVLAFAVIAAVVLEGVLAFSSVVVFSGMAVRLKASIDLEQIQALLGIPLRYFDKEGTGSFVSKFQEIEGFIDYVTSYNFVQALSSLGFIIIYLAVMAFYSVELTVLVLLTLPFVYLYLRSKTHSVYLLFNQKYATKAKVTSSLIETIRGIETIKSTRMEAFRYEHWRELEAQGLKAFYEASIQQGRLFHSFDIAGKLFLMIPLFLGAGLVMKGELTAGGLVAFYMLASKVFDPVFQVGNMWAQLQRHAVTLSELEALVTAEKEMLAHEGLEEPMESISSIDFHSLSFSYGEGEGRASALRDITIPLRAGKFYGIVGPTGSGKSTLIKLLHRHYDVEPGALLINGKPIRQYNVAALRVAIGFVPQEPLLFSGTLLENIVHGRKINKETVVEVARKLGSDDFISSMPEGYDTPLAEGGRGLSGGQKQQICILRALVSNPEVLILDEPTSAMDYATEAKVVTGILACTKHKTIIMIAHRVSTLRSADTIFVLSQGKLVESGSQTDLMQQGGYFSTISSSVDSQRSLQVAEVST